MSDHWNSLANLLGTPSIDPLQRKAVSPPAESSEKKPAELPRRERPAPAQRDDDDSVTSDSQAPSAPKTEPPSRIRASWDAVARLFGVAAPEPVQNPFPDPPAEGTSAPEATPRSKNSEADDLFSGFKGRSNKNRSSSSEPSSRAESATRAKEPIEPRAAEARSSEPRPAEPRRRDQQTDRSSSRSTNKPEESSSSGRKRPSSFWDSPIEEKTSSSPSIEDEIPSKREVADSNPRRAAERPVRRDETGEAGQSDPERRGRRRNIRRGRSESSTDEPLQDDASVELTESSEALPGAERSERSERPQRESRERSSRGRGERGERPQRADRPSSDRPSSDRPVADRPDREARPERTGRGERPVRGEQSGRDDRSVGSDRPERTSSAERPERSPTADRGRRPARDRSEGSDRSRVSRNEEPRARALPESSRSDEWEVLEPDSAFGSGIVEDGPSLELGDDTDEGGKRRRRRRGRRGRKPTDEIRDGEVGLDDVMTDDRQAYGQHMADDEDDDMADERLTKITSWLDAISPMIDANMENHKKSSGDNRGGRGGSGGGGRSGGGRGSSGGGRGGPRRGPSNSGNR